MYFKRKNIFKRVAIISLLIGVAGIDAAVSAVWMHQLTKHYQGAANKQTNAIVVLMGDFNDDYTDLGDETRRRLHHALSLGRMGASDTFLCVGGNSSKAAVIGSELMKRYLQENGISTEKILTEKRSNDTLSNWSRLNTIVLREKWRSIQVVSSLLHLHRFEKIIEADPPPYAVWLSPYPRKNSRPVLSVLGLWVAIHYEWAAYVSYWLPNPVYRQVVHLLR